MNLSSYVIGTLGGSFAIGMHQFGGDIAEMIVYEEELSTEEQTQLYEYIQSSWGL